MFATATKNFVEEVDPVGSLVPVSSLNDTIEVLTVVVKRKRFWFWQKPKYLPTDFNLNDILTGDEPINPVITEADFITYSGTYGGNIQGAVDANFVHSNVNVQGKDSSKLQSTFGSLKKVEVNVQKLLRDSKHRVLDMSHSLVQQTMEKHRRVFGIVKEQIVTTKPCSVIEEVQQGGSFGGLLTVCGPKSSKISLKENGSLSKDSNVTMEIPTGTTIAYGLLELEVKLGGSYELCLMSDTRGGFEVDSPADKQLLGASGVFSQPSENKHLQQDLEQYDDHFQLLSSLPASTKSSLRQHFIKVMQDQAALSALQNQLDHMRLSKTSTLEDVTITESARQVVQSFLGVVKSRAGDVESPETSLLTALHLISSALDEMPNDCLAIFGKCCSQVALDKLELLVRCITESGEFPLNADSGSVTLMDDVYENIKHLFAFSNVSLTKDGDTVKTEIHEEAGNLPLVLCIAARGLTSLAQS